MRKRKYNQELLDKVKELHLKGFTGVLISKKLNIPTSSISHFKNAGYCLDNYLSNNLSNARFYQLKNS